MMRTGIPWASLASLVIVSVSCGSSGPSTPTTTLTSPTIVLPPGVPPRPNFPAPTGPSRTFVFDHQLSYPVSDYTKASRFVLYDDGAFTLHYTSLPGNPYRGGYSDANGTITFDWEGWSVAGPWGATGTISGHTLTVRYNDIMMWTDFEDAVYRLVE
jgi:hypothetical protein